MKPKTKPALTARERVLLIVLPGALVLALYAVFFNHGHLDALNNATQQREKLRTQVGPMSTQPQKLAADLQRVKTELADLKHRLAAFTDSGSDAVQRSEAVVTVGALLRRHGMVVVEEGPSDNQHGGVPSTGRSSTGRHVVPGTADAVWQIRFLGTWSGVQGALEALPKIEDSACLPLSLSMTEPSTSSPMHEWTLRLRL